MISKSFFAMTTAVAVIASGPTLAQSWSHAPNVKEETNADTYHYEYDDGVCHINYQYYFRDRQEYLDRHGDCTSVAIPRYYGPNRVMGYGPPG
ncbi:MAG TPA: hypothetical protein VKW08_12945 [Xanthobacteraceae bacterium]|nr:hypothetical protein [Xanthobacteraceae bacterium]